MGGRYEVVRKSKVGEYIQNDVPFFVVDLEKKKVYASHDLRLGELLSKIDKETCFMVKEY